MLTSYSGNCQILPSIGDNANTDAFLYLYPNPYKGGEIDTAVCLSTYYASKINYWSKVGIKLSELSVEESALRVNLLKQLEKNSEKILFLTEENISLQKSNNLLTSENYRLNTALGNASNKLSGVSASLQDTKKRLKKANATTILVGFVGASVITILITAR